jgi:hypothetical protein
MALLNQMPDDLRMTLSPEESSGKPAKLLGAIINAVWVSECSETIYFEIEGYGLMGFDAVGDCCSESWFADFLGVKSIIGSPVVRVSALDLEEAFKYNVNDGRGRQDEDEVYGYLIEVENGGKGVLSFRNSSNGYYGGWLEEAYSLRLGDATCISNQENWFSA